MSGNVSSGQTFELSNLTAPASGKTRAIRYVMTTPGGGGTVTLDMASQVQVIGTFRAQSLTIDNKANAVPVTLSETGFGWSVAINPGETRTFNFPAVQYPVFTVNATASLIVDLSLFDFPSFALSTTNTAIPGSVANVNVSNTPLPVALPLPYTNNNSPYLTWLSGSGTTTFGVGTAGLNTYLLGIDLTVTGNATLAVAGSTNIQPGTTSTVYMRETIQLPTVAGAGNVIGPFRVRFDYPFLPSLGVLPTLEVFLSAALSGGTYNCNFWLFDGTI